MGKGEKEGANGKDGGERERGGERSIQLGDERTYGYTA